MLLILINCPTERLNCLTDGSTSKKGIFSQIENTGWKHRTLLSVSCFQGVIKPVMSLTSLSFSALNNIEAREDNHSCEHFEEPSTLPFSSTWTTPYMSLLALISQKHGLQGSIDSSPGNLQILMLHITSLKQETPGTSPRNPHSNKPCCNPWFVLISEMMLHNDSE